jgi:predicted DNA-binding transcriptional regulator AlpA
VSVEFTPTMMVRERTVWLTDHPGATVEDFDRLRRPFNAVHGGQHRRQHKAYLDWLNSERVMRLIGFPPSPLRPPPCLSRASSAACPRATCLSQKQQMDPLLNQHQAAHCLGLSVRALERHRVVGTGPRFISLGRLVKYRECDLAAWVQESARLSTSEGVGARCGTKKI